MVERCFFCGEYTTIIDEHYHYCPHCYAIYTYLIVHETNCDHITDDCPTVMRVPEFKLADDPYIVNKSDEDMECSVCGAQCVADGW